MHHKMEDIHLCEKKFSRLTDISQFYAEYVYRYSKKEKYAIYGKHA